MKSTLYFRSINGKNRVKVVQTNIQLENIGGYSLVDMHQCSFWQYYLHWWFAISGASQRAGYPPDTCSSQEESWTVEEILQREG